MTPTRPSLLVLLAILAAVIGWCVRELLDSLADRTIPVPWTAPATIGVLALSLFVWGLLARPRLQARPRRKEGTRPLSPFVAARTAALAMAASRTGALVGGFYLGVAAALLGSIQNEVVRQPLIAAGLSVLAALLLTLIALWLERMCRLPDDPDDREGEQADPRTPNPPATEWGHPARNVR